MLQSGNKMYSILSRIYICIWNKFFFVFICVWHNPLSFCRMPVSISPKTHRKIAMNSLLAFSALKNSSAIAFSIYSGIKKKKHFSLFQLQMNFNAQQSKQKKHKMLYSVWERVHCPRHLRRTNERRKAMHTNLAFFFVCSARRFDERWLRMRFIYELKNKSRLCWPFISIWLIYLKLIVWRNLHRAWQTNR